MKFQPLTGYRPETMGERSAYATMHAWALHQVRRAQGRVTGMQAPDGLGFVIIEHEDAPEFELPGEAPVDTDPATDSYQHAKRAKRGRFDA